MEVGGRVASNHLTARYANDLLENISCGLLRKAGAWCCGILQRRDIHIIAMALLLVQMVVERFLTK